MTGEEFKGWLGNVVNSVVKPITINGQSIGVSALDLAQIGTSLGKRSNGNSNAFNLFVIWLHNYLNCS